MKSSKTPDTPKNNVNRTDRVRKLLTPVIDRAAQLVGVGFILATSYGFTHDWLKNHQLNHDYSVAGGIMVVSIALYLVVRKR